MLRSLSAWVEHRTALRWAVGALLLEHIPGGARWRYVWGSCLTFVFALQVLTGVLLMTAYSPGNTTAWGSVFFIQYEMDFGWLIRGLHHFGSQAMVVLLFIHMLQVVIAGAQLPPREVNWWLGLVLMGIVLGLSLTGYLLPWDQKGFWATQVATKIMSGVPLIGPWLQNIVVGGSEYGNATLTRFFALHVAILPMLLVLALVAHLALFRRHGITYPGYPKRLKADGWFWPEQVFRDTVACLVVLGVLLFAVFAGHGYAVPGLEAETGAAANDTDTYTYWAKAGQRGLGANLDAPADPQTQYDPRPEWYYLFLFQLLKYFPGDQTFIGTQVIPGAVALILLLLPLLGFGPMRRLGHIVGVVVVVALIGAIVSLTCLALAQDTPEEIPHALLNRIAFIGVPIVAGVFLLHLAMAGLFRSGAARALFVPLGLTVVALLMVVLGGLIYAALTNQVPEPVAEIIKKKIDEEERADSAKREQFQSALVQAREFQAMVKKSEHLATRAIELAFTANADGARPGNIPVEGAAVMLQRDPKTQFPLLFVNKYQCSACHSYGDEQVVSAESLAIIKPLFKVSDFEDKKQAEKAPVYAASDLAGFGTQDWIYHFLKDPSAPRFYGRIKDEDGSPYFTRMSKVIKGLHAAAKEKGDPGVAELERDLKKIAAFLASHPTGKEFKDEEVRAGFNLFKDEKAYNCTNCHQYAGLNPRKTSAPDLTGYGSAPWLHRMITSPGHPDLYGSKNFMEGPLQGKNGQPHLDKNGDPILVTKKSMMPSFWPRGNVLEAIQREDYERLLKKSGVTKVDFVEMNDIDRELIVRGLLGDYRVVFGGGDITAVENREKK